MNNSVDIAILGGGPVGLFAAFYAGLRGMSVRIIDSLPELGGQLVALYPEKYVYDMPGFPKVLAKDLAQSLTAQALQFQPELCLEETAETLEILGDNGFNIITRKGTVLPCRTILIAAGAGAFAPTKLGIENEAAWEGKGLHYGVRSKEVFRDKKVMVIGGGDSAFDWALNLHEIAESIAIVHRRDVFRAHEDSVQKAEALQIPFHLWSTVKEIQGDSVLDSILLENTQSKEVSQHPCDAVIVNIGFKSSLGPIKDWGLQIEKNQISVDGNYETNIPGVFAVGDVCTHPSKLKLIATGVGEAATAVCIAKTRLDPGSKLFPGHSSDMELTGSPNG